MMTLLRPATTAVLLIQLAAVIVVIVPAVSALVVPQKILTQRNIHCQSTIFRRNNCCHDVRKKLIASSSSSSSSSCSCTQRQHSLSRMTMTTTMMMMMDPTNQYSLDLMEHLHASSTTTFDWLSSITLAKASSMASVAVAPNQSIAPLPETIQSIIFDATTGNPDNTNLLEVIPDLPSMPGGVPRSGNAFLSGSFRDLYQAPIVTPNPKMISLWNNNGIVQTGADGSSIMTIPSRELDVVARYADLLSRIPPMAAAYALIDFFVINAEEDLAIAELLVGNDDNDENESEAVVEAIMAVENQVVMQRFMGLFAIVAVTLIWSLLSYHPVPFNEL